MGNNVKTVVLLAVLTGILLFIGQLSGGRTGLIIAAGFAVLVNFGSYWYSDKLVLKIYRAKPLEDSRYPGVRGLVEEIASRASIPAPAVYVMPETTPNAFATGRNPQNSVIALTMGILVGMDRNQLRGVIAHEISHIKHRDVLISTIAAAVAGAIGFLAGMARWAAILGTGRRDSNNSGGLLGLLIVIIVAPIAAMIIQMAVSRSREYEADREGAVLSGNPSFLIDALKSLALQNSKQPISRVNPSTAHLFIVNPFKLKGINKLFSTHPPLEERIKRLEKI